MQPTTRQEFTTFINLILAVYVPFCPDRKLGPVCHQIGLRYSEEIPILRSICCCNGRWVNFRSCGIMLVHTLLVSLRTSSIAMDDELIFMRDNARPVGSAELNQIELSWDVVKRRFRYVTIILCQLMTSGESSLRN